VKQLPNSLGNLRQSYWILEKIILYNRAPILQAKQEIKHRSDRKAEARGPFRCCVIVRRRAILRYPLLSAPTFRYDYHYSCTGKELHWDSHEILNLSQYFQEKPCTVSLESRDRSYVI
jgi:hypothetical protein